MPQFQRDEHVDMPAILLAAAAVQFQYPSDVTLVEVTSHRRVRTQQAILDKSPHANPKPVLDRIGEPLLLPVNDLRRQPLFAGLFVKILSTHAVQFALGWQALDKLHQSIIHKVVSGNGSLCQTNKVCRDDFRCTRNRDAFRSPSRVQPNRSTGRMVGNPETENLDQQMPAQKGSGGDTTVSFAQQIANAGQTPNSIRGQAHQTIETRA